MSTCGGVIAEYSGSRIASSQTGSEMRCWSSIFLSTMLRRPVAAAGCATGQRLGEAMIAASSADSAGVSRAAHIVLPGVPQPLWLGSALK